MLAILATLASCSDEPYAPRRLAFLLDSQVKIYAIALFGGLLASLAAAPLTLLLASLVVGPRFARLKENLSVSRTLITRRLRRGFAHIFLYVIKDFTARRSLV